MLADVTRSKWGHNFARVAVPCSATLPAAVTAWHALVTKGNLTAGESVSLLEPGGFPPLAARAGHYHPSNDGKLDRAGQWG